MQYAEVVILVPPERVRAWVMVLAEALRRDLSVPVACHRFGDAADAPRPLHFESLERRIIGTPSPGHSDWISTADFPQYQSGDWTSSVVISAVERDPDELSPTLRSATILTPVFDGDYRFGAALTTHPHRAPALGVLLSVGAEKRLIHAAQVAVSDRELTLRAATRVLARTITLLRGAAAHLVCGKPLPTPFAAALDQLPRQPFAPRVRRILHTYLPKLGRRFIKPLRRDEDWCIAYRHAGSAGDPPDIQVDASGFSVIESDPNRFYADPMLFRHESVTALFFEDFDYRTNRGRISYVTLRDDGSCSDSARALSRPYHLSYPFVFSDHGVPLMLPETSNNRTVELYEAVRFPDRWRLRSVLLDNIEAADSTIFFDPQNNLWWLFAAISEYDDAAWDSLSIFFSPSVDGPWQAHAANPVKFDPSSSRPAGPIFRSGARLLRPAQDCTRGYGGGLVWCEIKELTPYRFAEEPIGRLAPRHGYTGLHTYSRAAGFEAVDFKRNRWRGALGRHQLLARRTAPDFQIEERSQS
jgi:hypothetical protein